MSLHYLSYNKKNSFNQGDIIPIGIIEALPGDSFQHKVTALLRTQPLLAPVMHSMECKIHHWFVPMRLIWEDWEDFITGGRDGLDESALPTVESGGTGFAKGSLADHLGIPPLVANLEVSALPFRAYNLIFNEFYRDQDLMDEVDISLESGEDTTTSTDLLKACWEKDYFTSARPTSQKGDPVAIPLAGNAPVVSSGTPPQFSGSGLTNSGLRSISGGNAMIYSNNATSSGPVSFGDDTGLEADLTNVSAVDVNDLRLAVKLQVFKENMLRHGSRYVERLMSGFGVRPQDSRLQLPEYLGGGKQTIQFSEVLQTAEGSAPVGEMRGHGIAAMESNRYRRYIPEYGYIISFAIIRPRTAYQNGLHKLWLRQVKEDFFQPELQHIGMQPIETQEIFVNSTMTDEEKTALFGFKDRYDEYRYMTDQVSGELRDTLDFWHAGRKFDIAGPIPALNADFVRCDGTDRIFATDADQFIGRFNHSLQVKRRVARNGKPMVF